MLTKMFKTYSELSQLKTFEDRFDYLCLDGSVGESTFGFARYLNQVLYKSARWRRTRREIILRDDACDLGMDGYKIQGMIMVHHMNPITIEDIRLEREELFDPELLISTSFNTHQAITYGNKALLPRLPIDRKPNDTCPWR